MFVYHRVPDPLVGDVLYPLNMLEGQHPEVAERHRAKYRGREALMSARIPPLDCLWNDVLMFSPVHPSVLLDALRESGRTAAPQAWFEVDAALLGQEQCTVLTLHPERPNAPLPEDYLAFTPDHLASAAQPTPAALGSLRSALPESRVLLFADIPHIFYRGTLSVGALSVIQV